MANALEINGKKLHPIKDATQFVSYSRDYITRLAREKKIVATYIGRQWFVDIESLKNYEEVSALEQELRKKQLSEERKKEQEVSAVVGHKKTVHAKREKTFHTRAVVATCLILGFGLFSGGATYTKISSTQTSVVASVSDSVPVKIVNSVKEVSPVAPPPPSSNTMLQADAKEITASSLETPSKQNIRPISDDVKGGVLLLPHGSVTATTTDMFSDEVEVFTSKDGKQMVVRIDEFGRPVGNVIPFVTVPVNHNGG